MQIRTLILSALSFATLLLSCESGSSDLPPRPEEQKCYKGEMTVNQNDGTFYNQSDVEVDYELMNGLLNFRMYKVKFANGMPIKLDMTVEGVDYTEVDGVITLSGNGLIPYAMGGPFEKFTITNLTGEITATSMSLDFLCGEYPVTYSGTK